MSEDTEIVRPETCDDGDTRGRQMGKCCLLCGDVDDDTELGWTVCRSCFGDDDEISAIERSARWNTVAQVLALVLFMTALFVLVMSLGILASAHADPSCEIDADGMCGSYVGPGMVVPAPLPPQPTYILNGDGSRMTCAPSYSSCW